MRAVIYGVKSSPDEKGAVDDQLKVIREHLPADRQEVAAFQEENQSGYRKSRGPELERAIQAALAAAREDGQAELWCWHSSRLARGTGKKGQARALGALFYELMAQGVTIRSALDDPYVATEEFIGMASRQSAKYSEDLGDWIRQGLERRKAKGLPVGSVPSGYVVVKRVEGQTFVSERVVDPAIGPVIVLIFERTARGDSTGDIARWLNGLGHTTSRGRPWRADTVRSVVRNDAYLGLTGYAAIVDLELAGRARGQLAREDPAARQRRQGGRKAKMPSILSGVAFCGSCGSSLWVLGAREGRPRRYTCRQAIQNTGLCSHRSIPAVIAEERVLEYLTLFVGDVEEWIGGQLAEREAAAVDRERRLDELLAQLVSLDRQREERMAELQAVGITALGLEVIERIDTEREARRRDVDDARAALAEWSAELDSDAITAFYQGLVDLVKGRVANAEGAAEVNRALHESLAGVWMAYDGKTLTAEVRLRSTGDDDIDVMAAALVPELVPFPEALALQAPNPSASLQSRW